MQYMYVYIDIIISIISDKLRVYTVDMSMTACVFSKKT